MFGNERSPIIAQRSHDQQAKIRNIIFRRRKKSTKLNLHLTNTVDKKIKTAQEYWKHNYYSRINACRDKFSWRKNVNSYTVFHNLEENECKQNRVTSSLIGNLIFYRACSFFSCNLVPWHALHIQWPFFLVLFLLLYYDYGVSPSQLRLTSRAVFTTSFFSFLSTHFLSFFLYCLMTRKSVW